MAKRMGVVVEPDSNGRFTITYGPIKGDGMTLIAKFTRIVTGVERFAAGDIFDAMVAGAQDLKEVESDGEEKDR